MAPLPSDVEQYRSISASRPASYQLTNDSIFLRAFCHLSLLKKDAGHSFPSRIGFTVPPQTHPDQQHHQRCGLRHMVDSGSPLISVSDSGRPPHGQRLRIWMAPQQMPSAAVFPRIVCLRRITFFSLPSSAIVVRHHNGRSRNTPWKTPPPPGLTVRVGEPDRYQFCLIGLKKTIQQTWCTAVAIQALADRSRGQYHAWIKRIRSTPDRFCQACSMLLARREIHLDSID